MRQPRTGRSGRGRSTGAAEHRTTVLSRGSVLVVALVVALFWIPVRADAQSTADRITNTRAAIDAAAQQWFEHQETAAQLEAEIAQLEEEVARATHQAAETEVLARARAVEIYKGTRGDVVTVLSVEGDDALASVRKAELLDRANAESNAAIDDFEAATEDLNARRETVEQRKAEQAELGEQIHAQQAALEERLADLEAQAQAEAAAAAFAARAREEAAATQARAATPAAKAAAPAPAASRAAPSTTSAPATGGTHPRHDEPFLVCTRARESSGQYGAVSSAGYYGAYQFSSTTWNTAASHAGRMDLIGVLPSQASAYDQDELAWALYQWQGNRPWGGRC
jgi:septal ring factor EnvC (AmiA/AmiB activator)